ncbi:MAG: hypothetical protein KC561_10955 [Myxococcales bacterium]|nr:hypothetical protein [Myxococcales bacterium]
MIAQGQPLDFIHGGAERANHMNLADLFVPRPKVAVSPNRTAVAHGLGSALERILTAQMPYMTASALRSSYADRHGDWESSLLAMEPVGGYHRMMFVAPMPPMVPPRIENPANDSRIGVIR